MNEIFRRVSIRKFTSEKVESEKLEQILKAAMQAPSAGNQQSWEFVIVESKSTLQKLSNMGPYSKFVADAPVAVVVLCNMKVMRYPENWMQDLGAATQNMLLEITSLGLGGVWATVAPLEDRMSYVSHLFELPEHILPYCVVPIGYPDQTVEVKSRYDASKVYKEGYQASI